MKRREAASHPRVPYIGEGTRDFFPRAKRHAKRRAARGIRRTTRVLVRVEARPDMGRKGDNND